MRGGLCAVAAGNVGAHPDDIGGFTGCFDDDIAALADSEGDDGCLVRFDGNEVVGDHCHGVSVDAEFLDCLNAGVDETEAIFLATCEAELGQAGIVDTRRVGVVLRTRLAVEVHLAIDKVVVRGWAHFGEICALDVLQHAKIVAMKIIIQGNRANIDIIVMVLGTVDYNGTPKPAGVLARVMRVIPGGPIGSSFETVSKAGARRNGTHGDGRDTVHPFGILLIDAVPMHGSAFFRILDIIMDSDLDGITPIGFD